MRNLLVTGAFAAVCSMTGQAAMAQALGQGANPAMGLTVTTGVDYSQGKYNTDSNDNWTWVVPVIVKYETGPVTLKLNVPYVWTHGVNREVGVAQTTNAETQSGLGDTIGSVFYSLLDPNKAVVGLDLGLKVKFVTADKSNDLITTGNMDYSLQADAYKGFGAITAFGTVGWVSKGNIDFINRTTSQVETAHPKDPWYVSIGGSYKLTQETSMGLAYDWREKLFDDQDSVSEATLFVTHKFGGRWKLQGYGVAGFSKASPDWGLGATLGYGF